MANVEIDVDATVNLGRPAVIHLPPEQCHPAEDAEVIELDCTVNGEYVEIDDIYINDKGEKQSLVNLLEERAIEEAADYEHE
jgi:hypothetical protein